MIGKRVLNSSDSSGFSCSFEAPTLPEWRSLRQQASQSVFVSAGWIDAWAASYLPRGRWRGPLRYLSVRNARGELVSVFPLARMKFGPLEFQAAAGPFLPYRGLVLSAGREDAVNACAAIADWLVDYTPWRLGLRLGPVCDQDTAIASLAAALQARGWLVCTRKLGDSMVVDVPADAAEFKTRSGGMIKRANYYERRMRRVGTVRIAEVRASMREQWPSAVDDAATVERNSWIPSANGNLLLSKVEDRRFWTQTVADEFVASALTFWIMYLDERPVSFSLTFDAGETKFILANLYDEQVKEHRTGNILACHVISRAVDQQCRYIDWGMGDSGYKKLWLARPGYGLHDVIAFPPWPMGSAFDWVMRRGFGFHAPMNGLAP